MKVLLVGNYEFDGSTSMKVWADALLHELDRRGIDVRRIAPNPLFGRIRKSATGIGKWLGYIDRFVIFPRTLQRAAEQVDVVHLCDHGSAMYAINLNGPPTLVTCHDMLAVRGAIGEVPDCPASFFGRRLQRWICKGLRQATQVACVSQFTFNDARRILNESSNLRVVLNGLNYPFQQLDAAEVERRLAGVLAIPDNFVLHVGSNHARKNREGILRIFAKVADRTNLRMVFVGEALSPGLNELARQLKVDGRIVQVVMPDVKVLEALYNRALVLLFPSRYEGFGWPQIEAQACGCPVVGSNIPPLVEVLSDSAVVLPVEDEAGMAEAICRLASDPEYREQLRRAGLENVRARFQVSRMMDEYVALYRELASRG